jgi:hypothetical protein
MPKKVKEAENVSVEYRSGEDTWIQKHMCVFVPEAEKWIEENGIDGNEYRIITEHRRGVARKHITLESK